MIAPRRTRTVALVVVIAAFAALTAFALLARAYRPGRAGVEIPNGALSLSTPHVASPIAASYPSATAAVGVDAPVPLLGHAPASPSLAPAGNPAPNTGSALAPCELGLAVPTESAGLANLVSLIPLFGPFSPEAFAVVPAFSPAFPLFGPLIIAGGQRLDSMPTDQAATALRPLENQGFDAISPLYSSARPRVLAGEAQLARALKPGVEALSSAPGATCLPAALSLLF